jgi:hypothetical protein
MEDQLRAAITRQADRYEVPAPDIEGFAAAAMRQRRRHRMVAALAACAVVGIVASGFLAGQTWWDTRGAAPADQPTSPTQDPTPSTPADDRVGIIGPPPHGTPTTGPATGKLVAAAELYRSGTWVYADGRIISVVRNAYSDEFRGYVVRQLTPTGVEAMRSFLLDGTSGLDPVGKTDPLLFVRDADRLMSARPFNGCRDDLWNLDRCPGFSEPEQWLPDSAWDDPTFRPFVPHAYQVSLGSDEEVDALAAELLPAEAADILLASPECPGTCWRVPNSAARDLAEIIDHAGPAYTRRDGTAGLAYEGPSGLDLVTFEPVLPHGGTYCSQCG